jgi:hypothetical protein
MDRGGTTLLFLHAGMKLQRGPKPTRITLKKRMDGPRTTPTTRNQKELQKANCLSKKRTSFGLRNFREALLLSRIFVWLAGNPFPFLG